MKRAGALTLVLLSCLLFPGEGPLCEESSQSAGEKLESIREKIGTTRERLDKTEKQEQSILANLEGMDREISRVRSRIKGLKKEEKDLGEKIRNSEKKLREIRSRREQSASRLSARATALYKAGHVSYLNVILSASGLEDLQNRIYYLRRLARHDSELFKLATDLFGREKEQMEELTTARSRLVDARRELEANFSSLSRKKQEKTLLLSEVKDRKSRNTQLLGELEASARHLKEILEALEREARTGESAFSSLKGSLKRPVSGRVIIPFGPNRSERFNTYTLSNGLTIQSAEGTPVRSVYGGKVLYADWLRGYGRIIIVDHGGGYYTLYGHLGELKARTGQEVEGDQVIGLVGDSGSLEGAGLYFEIRHHGKPVDPDPWFAG
ncbi:MAG: peptidoglycan DD-metalloendopeptidase family protein [Proteobacteria bacterium]|nr:peptidoglycan DD-metalloendopeptidase family protein [Pseudomonadota bacterium]